MSELNYSKTRIPYIELVDVDGKTYGKIIFSRITSTSAGYKYIVFTHRYTNSVASKTGKGITARTKFVDLDVNESYTFNMKMKRDGAGKSGVPQGMMPRRLVNWLVDLFSEYTVDGIMPYDAIPAMGPAIAEMDIDKIIVTDDDRVREAKKKAKAEKILARIAAEDKAEIEEQIIRDDYKNTPRREALEAEAVKKKNVNLSEIF
jgi:hypothetical protein